MQDESHTMKAECKKISENSLFWLHFSLKLMPHTQSNFGEKKKNILFFPFQINEPSLRAKNQERSVDYN